MIDIALTLLLAQATVMPSPPVSTCPTTPATIVKPAQPVYPRSLPAHTPPLTVTVQVTVNPDGSVKGARVWQSSDYAEADTAALAAAAASTYRPKMVNCEPVEGTYLLHSDFLPTQP